MKSRTGKKTLAASVFAAFKSFSLAFPVFLGVILLLGLLRTYVSPRFLSSLFRGDKFLDTLMGSIFGSLSAGNPVTSYIIGGELLKEGISLFAVTAFIVAWVTVGVIQFPAEAAILGKRFAFIRNLTSFLFSVIVSAATVMVLGWIR
jgi:uncharacterized membrane protein YraQ (UPF0718 family)